MCVYLYIHNKYTQHTHIYCVNKTFILDPINRLTALISIIYYSFLSYIFSFHFNLSLSSDVLLIYFN